MREREYWKQWACFLATLLLMIPLGLLIELLTGRDPDMPMLAASYALFRTFRWTQP